MKTDEPQLYQAAVALTTQTLYQDNLNMVFLLFLPGKIHPKKKRITNKSYTAFGNFIVCDSAALKLLI